MSWLGNGGTSSGEASKRATRSLNEAFLDLRPFGIVEDFAVVLSHTPWDVFRLPTDCFRDPVEFLADLPLSSVDCVDAKLDFRAAT